MNKYIETLCTADILSDLTKISEAKKQLIKVFHADIDQTFIDKRAAVKILREAEAKLIAQQKLIKIQEKAAKATEEANKASKEALAEIAKNAKANA